MNPKEPAMPRPHSNAPTSVFNVRCRMFDVRLLPLLFCALAIPARAQQPTPPQPPAAAATQPTQADLEKAFADRLTNAVMAGQYTVGKAAPKSDKYTIVSVRKLKDDNWLFSARIEFGGKDVTIPMI